MNENTTDWLTDQMDESNGWMNENMTDWLTN
jgi:hypothetical protein